jgi:hypothetical protein
MERSRKQNEDRLKSMKVGDGIGNVGRDCGTSMTGWRNIEVNGESLKSLNVTGEMSAEWAGRSRDVEFHRRHSEEGARHADHLMP